MSQEKSPGKLLLVVALIVVVLIGVTVFRSFQSDDDGSIRIGFIVKQPDADWFQLEWKFAEEAAAEHGFELLKYEGEDAQKVSKAIDSLAARKAQGFVICSPDVKLGPSILRQAGGYGLKFMSVDDRLVGADGAPLEVIPHLGISARKIGNNVGNALYDEMVRRKWDPAKTGACVLTFDELPTARERTEGAIEGLLGKGFPEKQVFRVPHSRQSIDKAYEAARVHFAKSQDYTHWLICGMNDMAVIGGVKASESLKFKTEQVIGIGINGHKAAIEFRKPEPTGLFGSILLEARKHGYDTARMVYLWAKEGKAPAKETNTSGTLVTRDNFLQVFKDQGLSN